VEAQRARQTLRQKLEALRKEVGTIRAVAQQLQRERPNGKDCGANDYQPGDFLRAELRTGLTLSEIALAATHAKKRNRNRVNARKAYDAVLRFLPGTDLAPDENIEINTKLEKLRRKLQLLDEVV
jgi:predicted mannosyl-3-phosphoglycerate phosphatase (HAD superfamily)